MSPGRCVPGLEISGEREVAVKVVQERYGPASAVARRFIAEARIAGQLQHPGVPAVHDFGTLPDGLETKHDAVRCGRH